MKSICFAFGFILSFGLSAQEVIASQGGSASNGTISMDWTIGETVIETVSDTAFQLTQGFHQPLIIITAVEDVAQDLNIRIFPNPTAALIYLSLDNLDDQPVYQLYDLNGKLLITENLNHTQTTIQMSTYPSGSYFLILKNKKGKQLGTFKIQKINH